MLGPDYERYYADGHLSAWRALSARDKVANIFILCRNIPGLQSPSIIEIGCGDGAIISELHRAGFGRGYAGFDISGSGIAHAKERPDIVDARFERFDGRTLPVGDKSYDIAILSHVLEHIADPDQLLREAARAARYVFIEVPLELNWRASRGSQPSEAGHINYYDQISIRRLAQAAGLDIINDRVTCPSREAFTYQWPGARGILRHIVKSTLLKYCPAAATRLFTYHGSLLAISTPPNGQVPLRVGIIQRVLADYRKPFFDRLASLPDLLVSVFAGQPLRDEGLKTAASLDQARLNLTRNCSIMPGIFWQRGLQDWLHSFNPDILVMEANPRLISNRFAIRWMRRRGRPVLGWGLGEMSRQDSSWLVTARRFFAADFLRRLNGVIAYSSKAAQYYERIGIPGTVFIAHNAIDNSESEAHIARLRDDDSWPAPWRGSFGLADQTPIILFVGRLLPQKRVELLIDACAPLFPSCQLLIVGDGPHMPDLKEHARPFADSIRFAGHLSGEDLAKCFLASDLFVLPGLGGLALYQAMSYGKPVLASLADGTESDLVQDGVNGMVFAPEDTQDLRAKIAGLLKDREKLTEMGRSSSDMIRMKMSLSAMIEAFHDALLRTTGPR